MDESFFGGSFWAMKRRWGQWHREDVSQAYGSKVLAGNPAREALIRPNRSLKRKHHAVRHGLRTKQKKEWKRMSKQLEQLGILTEIDMAAFAGYCQAYARWKEAEEFITQHGTIVKTPSGYWQQVPQVSIAQTYLKIMINFVSSSAYSFCEKQNCCRYSWGQGKWWDGTSLD